MGHSSLGVKVIELFSCVGMADRCKNHYEEVEEEEEEEEEEGEEEEGENERGDDTWRRQPKMFALSSCEARNKMIV